MNDRFQVGRLIVWAAAMSGIADSAVGARMSAFLITLSETRQSASGPV